MSKWSGFYQHSVSERRNLISQVCHLTVSEQKFMQQNADSIGDAQVENYLYSFQVPVGLLLDLPVNHEKYLVPMATEEPSVIAAANHGARLLAKGTGVITAQAERLMTGQVLIQNLGDVDATEKILMQQATQLIAVANQAKPSLIQRGGGAQRIEVKVLDATTLSLDLLVDPKEAMGANSVNTMLEAVASFLRNQGYDVLMAILSNYSIHALTHAQTRIPVDALVEHSDLSGSQIAEQIVAASRIEQLSVERAVTANKGTLNGIEAVVLASGNDTRNVNAALHAYASHTGRYRGLIRWTMEDDELVGTTELPLLVGSVGGSIGIVPAVQLNRRIMNEPDAKMLADLIIATGMAQNLAALRALVTDGIQQGHMSLQAKSLAVQVGARPEEQTPLVEALQQQAQSMDAAKAKMMLRKMRENK
ncbi:hydroxymethylglutaryl-CoA reductase, degradative [Weissella kandleri]|uniref:hydroxymethylglutaryl-CoA reductase, degradative n=1 Tax=Weissella kandleri TaxID=1616 RepID=UPI00387ED067